jgi:hypothetical protein
VTRSENSAYSSSVKRVLITRRRWGVLYFFMVCDLLSVHGVPLTNGRKTGAKAEVFLKKIRKSFCGIFSSGASRKKAGLGWQPQQDSHRTK